MATHQISPIIMRATNSDRAEPGANPGQPIQSAYDVILREQLITRTKGYETLTFKMSLNDPVFPELKCEQMLFVNMYEEFEDEDSGTSRRVFNIKKITAARNLNSVCEIYCEARWYELNEGIPRNRTSGYTVTAREALNEALAGRQWYVADVEIEDRHSYTITEQVSPLYLCRYIQKIWGGELYFNTASRSVSLYKERGQNTGLLIDVTKNCLEVKRTLDSTELITRVYMFGRDGLTIEGYIDARTYVEDYSYFNENGFQERLKSYTIEDERFTDQASMYQYMLDRLEHYKYPIVSYEISQYYFNSARECGDILYLYDDILGSSIEIRIVERTINIMEPWNSTYVSDNALEDLTSDIESQGSEFSNIVERQTESGAELEAHINNTVIHVSTADRMKWDGAAAAVPSNDLPLEDGTATAGVQDTYSRSDHVHPIGINNYFGVSNTAAATALKTVTISNLTEEQEGLLITVIFANSNTATDISLSVNGAAHSVYYKGSPYENIEADVVYMFVLYNSTWVLVNGNNL